MWLRRSKRVCCLVLELKGVINVESVPQRSLIRAFAAIRRHIHLTYQPCALTWTSWAHGPPGSWRAYRRHNSRGRCTWNVLWVLPVVSGSEIFDSSHEIKWEHLQRTAKQRHISHSCVSGPEPQMVACSKGTFFLLCNILWSHALLHIYWCVQQHDTHVHTQERCSYQNWNQSLSCDWKPEEAACLESTELLSVNSAPSPTRHLQ